MYSCVTFPNNTAIGPTVAVRTLSMYTDRDTANGYLRAIVRDEIQAFEQLCEMFCDPGWRENCEHLTEFNFTFGEGTNMLEGYSISELEPMREYIRQNYTTISEIYSQDLGAADYDKKRPLMLFGDLSGRKSEEGTDEYGEYLGHIYMYEDGKSKMLECIGIRSSLLNTIRVKLGLPRASRGVAVSILSGVNTFALVEGYKTIALSNPIGPKRYISEKFGFVDDEMDASDDAPTLHVRFL